MWRKVLHAVICFITLSETIGDADENVISSIVDNDSAESAPRLYRSVPVGAYASRSPYAAYSFQIPSFITAPNVAASRIVPVKQQIEAFHQNNGYLRDSYGNKFADTPRLASYRTAFPQQYVPLQELPAHLAQPLLAAPQNKETAPHYFAGSQYRVPTFQIASNHRGFSSFPQSYVYGQELRSLAPSAQQKQVNGVISEQQQPAGNKFYTNVQAAEPLREQKNEPQSDRYEYRPEVTYINNEKSGIVEQKSQNQEADKGQIEAAAAITPITAIVNGKKTVINIETQPPLPLLDLSLLEPITFDNPLVPQLQHFLPRIHDAKYHSLPEFNEAKQQKKSKSATKKKPKQHKPVPAKPVVTVTSTENDSPELSYEINTPNHKESYNEKTISYNKKVESEPETYSYNEKTEAKPVHYSYQNSEQKEPVNYNVVYSSDRKPEQLTHINHQSKEEQPRQLIYKFNADEAVEPPSNDDESESAPGSAEDSGSAEVNVENEPIRHLNHDNQDRRHEAQKNYHNEDRYNDNHSNNHHQHHNDNSHNNRHHNNHPNNQPHNKPYHNNDDRPEHRQKEYYQRPEEEHNTPNKQYRSQDGEHNQKTNQEYRPNPNQGHHHREHNENPGYNHDSREERHHKPNHHREHNQNHGYNQDSSEERHKPSHHREHNRNQGYHHDTSEGRHQKQKQEINDQRSNQQYHRRPDDQGSHEVEQHKDRKDSASIRHPHRHSEILSRPQEIEEDIRLLPPQHSAPIKVDPSQHVQQTPNQSHNTEEKEEDTPQFISSAPIIQEQGKRIIIKEESPEELHMHQEQITAEVIDQEDNNEEDFEKAYKNAAYGFPAFEKKAENIEKEIYNPASYGYSRGNEEFNSEKSPFQQYVAEGDSFPKKSRFDYNKAREDTEEGYLLDYSANKPESVAERYRNKANYYKLYEQHKPEKYFNRNDKQEKQRERYTAAPTFHYERAPKPKSSGYFAQYKAAPIKYEYDYSKGTPRDNSAHASNPYKRLKSKTLFVEPQFQYGFDPISLPRLLDSELAAMASNHNPESEKPGMRKKIYEENWYIKKTSTAGGNKPS